MLSNAFLNCNAKTRAEMTELFLEAGIAYLSGANWKSMFKKVYNSSAGTKKRFCEFWLTRQNKDMLLAIDSFLRTYQ
jgi:hypothetical protein